jgi:hypothetical protein
MENLIQQQIIEEFEIRLLGYRLLEKKLIRSIKIWETHYKKNTSKNVGLFILMKKIRPKKEKLYDTQKALIDLEYNKQFYVNFKN